ncbi:MFS transporter, partial [Pseudomonas aeruginosa]
MQLLVPDWIKSRALSLYQTALYGGLALGSFLWGHLAETMHCILSTYPSPRDPST